MIKYETLPVKVDAPFFYSRKFMNKMKYAVVKLFESVEFEHVPNKKQGPELKNYQRGFFIKRYNVHKIFLDSRTTFTERKKGKCFNLEDHPKSVVLRFKDKR
ncbi:hypothetical protein XaC1_486 [Xanthomonas phage XaC1]|nr:hypothetical protein XaC1_486 [Xanthomonas phage XaC1]